MRIGMRTVATGLAVLCMGGMMTGCHTMLAEQKRVFDTEFDRMLAQRKWAEAEMAIKTSDHYFDLAENEKGAFQSSIEGWRGEWDRRLKREFSQVINPEVEQISALYAKYAFDEGEMRRKAFIDAHDKDVLSVQPCVEVAEAQLQSDRNVARMTDAYQKLDKRIEAVDQNDGSKAVQALNVIVEDYGTVVGWQADIDRFMNLLDSNAAGKWWLFDRSEYAERAAVRGMADLSTNVLRNCQSKRWNSRVVMREGDYAKVAELVGEKKYADALEILRGHDFLVQPENLQGLLDFDDAGRRAKVCDGELGVYIVKQVFTSSLPGVQQCRLVDQLPFSLFSAGRTPIENLKDRKRLREAGRLASLQARAEFVEFMSSKIEAELMHERDEKIKVGAGGEEVESNEKLKEIARSRAEAEVSNFMVIATGITKGLDGDEVVYIVGWRKPEAGSIIPGETKKVEGDMRLFVSPSAGSFL